MNEFLIMPSEAILLGRCLELYLHEVSDSPEIRFIDHVRQELQFLPDFEISDQIQVIDSAPDNVEWTELTPDFAIGLIETRPGSVFLQICETTFEQNKRPVKKTFDLQVIDFLAECLDESTVRIEQSRTLPARQWQLAYVERMKKTVGYLGSEEGNTESAQTRAVEDFAGIEDRLAKLVRHPENAHEVLFDCGRILGKLEAWARRFLKSCAIDMSYPAGEDMRTTMFEGNLIRKLDAERFFGRWLPTSEDTWHRESIDPLKRLLSGMLPLSALSQTVLQELLHGHSTGVGRKGSLSSPPDDQAIEATNFDDLSCSDCLLDVFRVQEYISKLKFVLGEVTGYQRSADADAVHRDSQKPIPRIAKLSPNSNASRIRGHLDLVEAWFSMDVNSKHLPSAVVSEIHNAIEPLARRNWPKDFEDGDITSCLSKRKKFGSKEEQEFAEYAHALYRQDRNVAAHDVESVDYSMQKALLFMYGVRTLLALSDIIVANQRKDS